MDRSPEGGYDLTGYWKHERGTQGFRGFSTDPEAHGTDKYKRPEHPSFSDESIHASAKNPGGHWVGENYIPQGTAMRQLLNEVLKKERKKGKR
jgi:hypothetical protein